MTHRCPGCCRMWIEDGADYLLVAHGSVIRVCGELCARRYRKREGLA